MKKKIATLLLVSVCLCSLVLTGCGNQSTQTATTTAEPAAETETSAAELIKDIPTVQAFTDEAVEESDITAIVMAGVNAPSSMNKQPWHFTVVTNKSVLEEMNTGMSFGGSGGDRTAAPGEAAASADGIAPEMPAGAPEGFTPGADGAPEGFSGDTANLPEGFTPGTATPPEGFTAGAEGMPSAPSGGSFSTSGAKAGIADAPLAIVISCKAGSELDAGLAAQNMAAEAALLGYGTKIISSPTMTVNGARQAEFKELLGIPDDMSAVCFLLIGKTDTETYDAVTSATTRNTVSDTVTFLR